MSAFFPSLAAALARTTEPEPPEANFLGWTAGTRADAEHFAREVAAEHGLRRIDVYIRAAEYGWDVFAR